MIAPAALGCKPLEHQPRARPLREDRFAETLRVMSQRTRVMAGALGGTIALLLAGCGGAVSFSGAARAPVTEPASITSSETAPAGTEQLGRAEAECNNLDPAAKLDGVKLADLACSRALLVAALQDRAASVGGTLLVGTSCFEGTRTLECSAQVWAPAPGAKPGPAPERPINVDRLASVPGGPPRGSVADAWRVRVEAWPLHGGSARRERSRPESVEELAVPSMAQVPIGDVRAYCDGDCKTASVREALRLAAAHLGGSSVVAVRCIHSDDGATCVGTAAALIAPDERRSEAR